MRFSTLVILTTFLPGIAWGQPWKPGFIQSLKNGAVYAEDSEGKPLIAHRTDDAMIPASTMKVATAACAIKVLGRDFRYVTDFLLTRDGRLVIRGAGDPFLVSEELAQAAHEIAKTAKTLKSFRGIVLDTSYFDKNLVIDGTANSPNPYDALNGALIANFNTINVHKMGSGPRAALYSAEPQTPLTSTAREAAAKLGSGKQRINIGQDPRRGARYAGELMAEFLKKEGVNVEEKFEIAETPEGSDLLYHHLSSRRLEDVVRELLKFSTNFMANQVFLTVGAHVYGAPATVEKGQRVLSDFLKKDVGWSDFSVHEGAGLSRKNHVTAREMVNLLKFFEPNSDLLPEEEGGKFRAKTGTLTGVNTLAGYMPLPDGKHARFAILVNDNVPFDYKFKLGRLLYAGLNNSGQK